MSELTKEQFEEILDQKFEKNTNAIIKRIDESQEELARMVAEGFDDIRMRLDVSQKLERHEKAIKLLAQYADIKEIAAILK